MEERRKRGWVVGKNEAEREESEERKREKREREKKRRQRERKERKREKDRGGGCLRGDGQQTWKRIRAIQ